VSSTIESKSVVFRSTLTPPLVYPLPAGICEIVPRVVVETVGGVSLVQRASLKSVGSVASWKTIWAMRYMPRVVMKLSATCVLR
jgi:hypothetical protein